ncbi:Hypothetical predicted protein, partial [Paramuricea clavata]
MEISCSLKEIIGGTCGYDRKDRTQSTVVIPLQVCNKEIVAHKSTFQFSGIESEVELILSRAGIFISPENIHCWTICPLHRSKLGLGWSRGNNARCRVPAALSSHRQANGKWPKCDRGINKDDSQLILKMTGIFLQVGSGICSTCRKKLRALVLTSPHKAESVIDQMDALTLVKNREQYTCAPLLCEKSDALLYNNTRTPRTCILSCEVANTPINTSFLGGKDISTTLSTPRENLNAFLTSRDYEGYCKEVRFQPMSRSTLRRVLKVCSASAHTSLQGLDYISAMGGQAFDDLENVVDMLGDRYGKGLAWAKQTNQKLKDAKRYLKGDYKIHISSNSEVADHCRTYALSFPNDENYTNSCDHEHKGKCDRWNDIENPEQMKAAIESFEGIPGVKVTVCAPPPGVKGMAGEWDGVSLINNIEYPNESMT